MTALLRASGPGENVPNPLQVAVQDDRVLLREDLSLSEGLPAESLADPVLIGTLDGRPVVAGRLVGEVPEGLAIHGLRPLHARVPADTWALLAHAVQMAAFHDTHRFCGRDGTPTVSIDGEQARRCPVCGLSVYPRVAPAVIVLIRRGDELLLARSPRFPPGMYSTVAGFVESGETLEDTVHREILEEVGVRVTNLRYFASQPWPFPHSLMVGFLADYAGGEIVPQPGEIEDARWFRLDALPRVPDRASIARRLIESAAGRIEDA